MDHDFLLSRDDLLRYANHSLTYRIVDRIFQGAPRKLSTGNPDKMGYEAFIWFLLAEVDPAVDGAITLKDLKQCQMSPNFFNTLFNLNKFLAFEQRDPFINKQETADDLTEWERFARAEYMRLTADEEEGEDLMQDLDEDLDM